MTRYGRTMIPHKIPLNQAPSIYGKKGVPLCKAPFHTLVIHSHAPSIPPSLTRAHSLTHSLTLTHKLTTIVPLYLGHCQRDIHSHSLLHQISFLVHSKSPCMYPKYPSPSSSCTSDWQQSVFLVPFEGEWRPHFFAATIHCRFCVSCCRMSMQLVTS